MKKMTVILSAVLLVQVILAAILFSQDQEMGAFQSNEKLLGLELANLDQITIETKDKKISLKKQQGKWILPEHFNAPADSKKIRNLADKLFALLVSWPVATSEVSAPRFKVTEDQFVRKISFAKSGKNLKTLYLGSSPGFKKIHARVDGQNDIYSIEFAAYETPVNVDDWVDKNLLVIDVDSLNKVVSDKFSLSRDGDSWQVDNLKEGKIANQEKIKTWLEKLAKIQYNGILGTEAKPEYGLDKAVITFKLMPKSGDPIKIAISKMANDYVIKSSHLPFYFKASQYQVQALLDANVDTFSEPRPSVSPDANNASEAQKAE
jgi:hypothetical protein